MHTPILQCKDALLYRPAPSIEWASVASLACAFLRHVDNALSKSGWVSSIKMFHVHQHKSYTTLYVEGLRSQTIWVTNSNLREGLIVMPSTLPPFHVFLLSHRQHCLLSADYCCWAVIQTSWFIAWNIFSLFAHALFLFYCLEMSWMQNQYIPRHCFEAATWQGKPVNHMCARGRDLCW